MTAEAKSAADSPAVTDTARPSIVNVSAFAELKVEVRCADCASAVTETA